MSKPARFHVYWLMIAALLLLLALGVYLLVQGLAAPPFAAPGIYVI